jgi:hypothetical protein
MPQIGIPLLNFCDIIINNQQQLRPTRIRERFMNDFHDDYFTFISEEGKIIEFTIRELIDHEFNQVLFPDEDIQRYTKQEKIEVMKNLIDDIEKCISIIEKNENAKLSDV